MVNPVGYRFRPTDEEIILSYLRPKNLDCNTSHVDQVISTVHICSFDPWDLRSESRIKSRDQAWYFFGRKENKYKRGDQQCRKTSSGSWKKTGETKNIMRKTGNREKIGEKRFFVYRMSKKLGGTKTQWVMHEYDATFMSPPNQMMIYTLCKVKFKGDVRDLPSSSSGGGESEGSSFGCQELENPRQFSGFLTVEEETPFDDELRTAINNFSTDEYWNSLFN